MIQYPSVYNVIMLSWQPPVIL